MKTQTTWLLICCVFFAAIAGGCSKNDQTRSDSAQPGQDQEIQTEELFEGVTVKFGDRVTVNFSILLPDYLYINTQAPKPVKIMVPGNTKFYFEKTEFGKNPPVFPMRIDFQVPRDVGYGEHEIPLAMRLLYCNKANDVCIIKNEIVKIGVKVIEGASVNQRHILEKTYRLD